MPTLSPQIGLPISITCNQTDIQVLYSVGKTILYPEPGYAYVFTGCRMSFSYKNSVFTNCNNLLGFYQQPEEGDPILVSNLLNAFNIIGRPQNMTAAFDPAVPYSPLMSDSGSCGIVLKLLGEDPTGGDPASLLMANMTYNVHAL